MPQLDRIIIFSQIFWLFVIFASLYAILTHFFLPKFLKSLKTRKQIINSNVSESSNVIKKFNNKQLLLKQLLLKDLKLVEDIIANEFLSSVLTETDINQQFIDEKIGITSLSTSLYCDNQLLNSISLYPKLLNLKFKIT